MRIGALATAPCFADNDKQKPNQQPSHVPLLHTTTAAT